MAPYDHHAIAVDSQLHQNVSAPVEVSDTRFGTLRIAPEHILHMPQGPFGFADHTRFGLADAPNAQAGQFRIFQAMDDPSVSFVVLPAAADNDWIAREDFMAACESYCLSVDHAGLLLLVTLRRSPTGALEATVNLKAPIVIDTLNQVARQIVFAGDAYEIRRPLDLTVG